MNHAVAAVALTEEQFQQHVITLAKTCGWEVYHTRDSRRSAAGYPDLTLVRPPRLIFAELKTDTGVVSAAQQGWLDLLGKCPGTETSLWRPRDWEAIVDSLSRKSPAARAALEGERP